MTDKHAAPIRPTLFGRINIWLAMTSAVVLALMMILVFAGVIMRYVFNNPIQGTNEVLAMASVTFVMLAIPYCTYTNSHIKIDMLDAILGHRGVQMTEIAYRVLAIVLIWFLVKSTIKRASDALEFEDVTNMIEIPLWPFYWMVVIGMGFVGVILMVQLVSILGQLWWRRD